jgi:hypothetical protein
MHTGPRTPHAHRTPYATMRALRCRGRAGERVVAAAAQGPQRCRRTRRADLARPTGGEGAQTARRRLPRAGQAWLEGAARGEPSPTHHAGSATSAGETASDGTGLARRQVAACMPAGGSAAGSSRRRPERQGRRSDERGARGPECGWSEHAHERESGTCSSRRRRPKARASA